MTLPAVKTKHPLAASRFTADQVDLIKRTICKGATDDELRMFLYQADRTGLDPLARQIYSIERRERRGDSWVGVRSIQTSIDGFRLIAERSGKYAGQLGPYWCGLNAEWLDVWLSSDAPAAARVGVIRTDFKEPCWGVARFDAYAQKKDGNPTRMWATMADVMVAKCAEALALRRAFPQELSGLYTTDEMEQAGINVEAARFPPTAAPNVMVAHDKKTVDITELAALTALAGVADTAPEDTPNASGAALSLEDMAREAAMRGEPTFKAFYKSRSAQEKKILNGMGDELRGLMAGANMSAG